MNIPTNYQTIDYHGKPAFVLVPWEQFSRIAPYLEQSEQQRNSIPQSVVEANLLHGVPIIKAWREYLKLTQEQVASQIGMKQPSLARIETGAVKPRKATLVKLAALFGVTPELLEE